MVNVLVRFLCRTHFAMIKTVQEKLIKMIGQDDKIQIMDVVVKIEKCDGMVRFVEIDGICLIACFIPHLLDLVVSPVAF